MEFIYELNLSRRHFSTYPPGHPLIESSCDKALAKLSQLFKYRETISFGISKDALMFDQKWLDKKNPGCRDLASALARLGIAAISFHRKPQRDELLKMNQVLCMDRQTIIALGGFELLLSQRQVAHIEITPIDYSSFQATEEEHPEKKLQPPSILWENFITQLFSGKEQPENPSSETDLSVNPKVVAETLNQRYQQQGDNQGHDHAITSFIRNIQKLDPPQEHVLDQFAELISQLAPELRCQFLANTFSSLDPSKATAELLLGKLPNRVLLAALEEIKQKQLNPSGILAQLISKLARQPDKKERTQQPGPTDGSVSQLQEQLTTIFREEEKGKYNPEAYQQALDKIVNREGVTLLPPEDAKRLRRQIDASSVERHSCAILLKLFHPELDPVSATGLQNTLIDLALFFLEIGDFKGLRYLHSGLLNYLRQNPHSAPEQTSRLRAALEDPQFQKEVLGNLSRWGEEKQKEIRAYILATGAAFAKSLVQHLATEEDRGLRRLYVNALADLGQAAHDAIYPWLNDPRWFLVRNLLNILRIQNDPPKLEKIYPLEKHPHLRVNQEVLKLLFKFNRSRADGLLLKQLSSTDPDLQAHAISLAEHSRSPEIVNKLLQLLTREKPKKKNLPLNLSIVKSLSLIGSEKSLPALEKLLFSGWLFTPWPLKQLKLEIVGHLDRYGFNKVQPLLTRLASSRHRELRRLAVDKLSQATRS